MTDKQTQTDIKPEKTHTEKNFPHRDNYAAFAEQGRQRFLLYDQEAIIRRFHLQHDSQNLYFHFLDQKLAIDRSTGKISLLRNFPVPSTKSRQEVFLPKMQLSMTIFDLLTRGMDPGPEPAVQGNKVPDPPVLSGEWVTLTQLGGIIAAGHVKKLSSNRNTNSFTGKTAALKTLCEALNGTPMKKGDVSYVLPVFTQLPVWLQFWDADDEFDAKLQFLWDRNTLQFLHYETLWYLMDLLTSYLLHRLNNI